MSRFKRLMVSLLFVLSLGALMGQDGFCFFAGEGDTSGGVIVDD